MWVPTLENCARELEANISRGFNRGDNLKTQWASGGYIWEISSTERISSQTIELSSRIHRRVVKVLLDRGSTGNYISDQVAHSFDLIVQAREGGERLTLADGSKVQTQGCVSFCLQCDKYNSEVITRGFPNIISN